MSMWKNIKSLFIIEEEAPPEQQGKEVSAKETEAGRPAAQEGQVKQELMEVLLRAMSVNNIEGFDYLEYKKSLNSLKNMPMDEPTRYKSALAMAKTMGAVPGRLIETAQHYLDVLEQEEAKFQEALANQKALQIESKEEEIRKLEGTIREKAEKIKRLTQEIEGHQKNIAEQKAEMEAATSKVTSTKNNFIASYQALVSQIQRDIENMKQHLQ